MHHNRMINSLILEERETFCEMAPLLLFTLLFLPFFKSDSLGHFNLSTDEVVKEAPR